MEDLVLRLTFALEVRGCDVARKNLAKNWMWRMDDAAPNERKEREFLKHRCLAVLVLQQKSKFNFIHQQDAFS